MSNVTSDKPTHIFFLLLTLEEGTSEAIDVCAEGVGALFFFAGLRVDCLRCVCPSKDCFFACFDIPVYGLLVAGLYNRSIMFIIAYFSLAAYGKG